MAKSIDRSRKLMQKWLMAIIQDQVYLLGWMKISKNNFPVSCSWHDNCSNFSNFGHESQLRTRHVASWNRKMGKSGNREGKSGKSGFRSHSVSSRAANENIYIQTRTLIPSRLTVSALYANMSDTKYEYGYEYEYEYEYEYGYEYEY